MTDFSKIKLFGFVPNLFISITEQKEGKTYNIVENTDTFGGTAKPREEETVKLPGANSPKSNPPSKNHQNYDTSLKEKIENKIKDGSFKIEELQSLLKDGNDLSRIDLSKLPPEIFKGKTIEGGKLNNAVFPKNLKNIIFNGVELKNVMFEDSKLENICFANCKMQKTNFEESVLTNVHFVSGVNLNGSNFKAVSLNDCRLEDVKLCNSTFERSFKADKLKPRFSNVKNTEIINCDLTLTDFSQTSFDKVSFAKKNDFSEVSFSNSNFTNVFFDNDSIYSKTNFTAASFQDICFKGNFFNNSFFSGAKFKNVDFTESRLDGISFGTAVFENTNFTRSSLFKAKVDEGVGFSNAKFLETDLRNVDISKARLSGNNDFTYSLYTDQKHLPTGIEPVSHLMILAPRGEGLLEAILEDMPPNKEEIEDARKSSIIPNLKKKLNELSQRTGISFNGENRKIALLEPGLRPGEDKLNHSYHSFHVNRVIDSPESYGGLIPKVQVTPYKEGKVAKNIGEMFEPRIVHEDTENHLRELIDQESTSIVKNVTNTLETICDSGIKYDAINGSLGWSQIQNFQSFDLFLNQKVNNPNVNGIFKYPEMRKVIYGDLSEIDSPNSNQIKEQKIRLAGFVGNHINKSEEFKNAISQYKQITEKLWDKGIPFVIAIGNQHIDEFYKDTGYIEGSDLNYLAMGKVISVAASYTNKTPEDLRDDVVADFSSRGIKDKINPTITAPGDKVLIGINSISGTSFASPLVASVIALFPQDMPLDEKFKILTKTAVDTKASDIEEGSGMIDPYKAIVTAWKLEK